jgi:hypothetical protein
LRFTDANPNQKGTPGKTGPAISREGCKFGFTLLGVFHRESLLASFGSAGRLCSREIRIVQSVCHNQTNI